MAAQLETSKIDGLVMVGAAASNAAISAMTGLVMVGAPAATLEIAKLDSFTMVQVLTVQHEHIFTGQWIGPPAKVGT